jgi:hypothetical protein
MKPLLGQQKKAREGSSEESSFAKVEGDSVLTSI